MYIFEIKPLSVASFAIIFSHSEGCLFTRRGFYADSVIAALGTIAFC